MLPSEHLFGDWGGLRPKLEESGITPRLILVTDLAGNPRGGRSQGVTAPTSVELSLFFDLDKLFGLKGGSIFASFSERWGHSLSAKDIGNTFSTQEIFGFQTWRVIDVSYQQKLFEDRVELRVGRFPAMDDFLVSPYNFGLMQNAFCGNPFGIILDAPGMSAYYGTWAALGKVKPTRRSYVMTGVYNGDPKMRDNKYHGVNLSLDGPLFVISEAGYQINGLPGDSQRLGNYKVGAWYDHARLTDFESGASKRGSWGYYGLFRPGARSLRPSQQQPRIRRFRFSHGRARFPPPTTAVVLHGWRFGAWAARHSTERCPFVWRGIWLLQRRPATRAAKMDCCLVPPGAFRITRR